MKNREMLMEPKKVVPQEGEDNFGNKIVAGDEVYYASSDYGGRNYRINTGVVEGFNECKVIVNGKYLTSEKLAKALVQKEQKNGRWLQEKAEETCE